MTYNLVAIRAIDDPYDPLYPRLVEGGKGIVTYPPSDGEPIVQIPFNALYIYEQDPQGQQKQLGSFTEGSGVLFLTRSRTAVHLHDFKTGDFSLFVFDLPNLYAASYLLAKARTHNRAVVGHIPHVCLRYVGAYTPTKRGEYRRLSLGMDEKTGDALRTLRLSVHVQPKHDLGNSLAEILTRYADYWLKRAEAECGLKLGEEHKIRLGMVRAKATQGRAELPPPGEWRNYNLPAHAPFTASAAQRIGMKAPI